MEYRIDQLAATSRVSVDTVRYYQSRRLLPPPRRAGRIAWYGEEHVQRISRIRGLQGQGLTLAAIRRVIVGELDRADADLAVAVATAFREDERLLTLEELAARSGIAVPLLQALIRAGIDLGRRIDGESHFTEADITMVQLGLRLLEAGLPLPELLEIAGEHAAEIRRVAERAVDLFDRYVRQPIHDRSSSEEAAARELVTAFEGLLPAVTALVAHHFRQVLLAVAEEHIAKVGDEAEIAAARAAGRPPLHLVWPP